MGKSKKMSSSYGLIQKFYQNRASIPADRHILSVLKEFQSELQPGNDLAKLTEMSLLKQPVSCHMIDQVASAHLIQTAKKNIMLIAVEEENPSIYRYLAEMMAKRLDVHTDLFLHYPYSKDRNLTKVIGKSYCAKDELKLDTDKMAELYPHVRFHYCDLRTEWHPDESSSHLYGRVKLLNDYACYLAHQDLSKFTEEVASNHLKEEDILQLDVTLAKLEGKIMKSFYKTENSVLADEMIGWFERVTQDCRRSIQESKQHIYEKPSFVIEYYLEYLKELNHLYQYVNTLYTVLRMFRSFKKVSYQNSESPSHCIVVMPKQMVDWMVECIEKNTKPVYTHHIEHSPSKISQCDLDNMFLKWKQ